MSTVSNILRLFSVRSVIRKNTTATGCLSRPVRTYADSSETDSSSKQIVAQGTENEERVRVRRARVSDVPRVLRFVRENVRVAWPALVSPPAAEHVVLVDYVTRTLAQGHSMLAEQQEVRGWSQIRGLALSTALCPWDAAMLERWARCVKCSRSRKLMNFTAHCLRAPALHDKYRVHNILQVVLIVPPNTPKTSEIINVLAKNAIQRGREVGFPLIRFDVSNDFVSKSLEELNLRKEWHLSYEIVPQTMKEKESDFPAVPVNPQSEEPQTSDSSKDTTSSDTKTKHVNGNYIAVYTAFTDSAKAPANLPSNITSKPTT